MNARVTLSNNLAKQKSLKGKLLLFLQEHPTALKNTNCKKIAERIDLANRPEFNKHSIDTIRFTLNQMVHDSILFRLGGKKRANFSINYYSPLIPGYVIDEASDEAKQRIAEWKARLNKNSTLNKDGSITTLPEKKVEEKPKQEEPVIETVAEPVSVPVEEIVKDVKIKSNGGTTLSITFNISIN